MKSRRDFVKITTLLSTGLAISCFDALAPNMAFGMASSKKEKMMRINTLS